MSIEWVQAFRERGFVVKSRLCTSNHWTSLHVVSRLNPSSSNTPSTTAPSSINTIENASLGSNENNHTEIFDDGLAALGVRKKADFAAKTIVHGGVMRTEDMAIREVDVLKNLKHPHVVAYEDSFSVPPLQAFVLVMQFCEGGDLRQLLARLQNENRLVPEPLLWSWLAQITDALNYCHGNHVVHRDLKTSNIFLKPGYKHVLIGDFGIARVLETASLASSCVGTPAYMSPELVRSEPYTYSTDVWALGVVLFEIITLKLPFASGNLLGLVNKIANADLPSLPDHTPTEIQDLIPKMLAKQGSMRCSITDILQVQKVKRALALGVNDTSIPVIEFATPAPILQEESSETDAMASGSLFKALQDVGVPLTLSSCGSMFSVAEITDLELAGPAAVTGDCDVPEAQNTESSVVSIFNEIEKEVTPEEVKSPLVWEDGPQKEKSHQEFRTSTNFTPVSNESSISQGTQTKEVDTKKINTDSFNSTLNQIRPTSSGGTQTEEVQVVPASASTEKIEKDDSSSVGSFPQSPPPLEKFEQQKVVITSPEKNVTNRRSVPNRSRGINSVVPQTPVSSFPNEFSFERLFAKQMELLKAKESDEIDTSPKKRSPSSKSPSNGYENRKSPNTKSPGGDSASSFNNSLRKKAPVPTFSNRGSPTKRRS